MSKEVSKETLIRMQEALRVALDSFCEAEGLEVVGSKGKYGYKGTVTFEVAPVERDEETGINLASPEAQDWALYAPMEGFDADDLGKTFVAQGEEYAIAGYKPRATKRPICVVRTRDGARFVMPVGPVQFALRLGLGASA